MGQIMSTELQEWAHKNLIGYYESIFSDAYRSYFEARMPPLNLSMLGGHHKYPELPKPFIEKLLSIKEDEHQLFSSVFVLSTFATWIEEEVKLFYCVEELMKIPVILYEDKYPEIIELEWAYQESLAKTARIKELESAMRTFVERVDAGEVRSKKTYAQFKALLVGSL